MSKNKKIILIILSIFIVLGLFLGVYYVYYIKSINQEESNIVKTKCLNFSITNEKNDINLDEQYPIPDTEGRKLTPYQFTITNTCEQFISYNVNLESLEATTMDSSAVKVMINNEAPVNLSTLESTSVSIDTSKDSKILATGSLGSNDSVDYALRLWMDYGDTVDTSSMNKVFESKVVVTATVGTYKPSDYVTTLHDAILVNEYGVTDLNNAINRIEAKGTPDLSKMAPSVSLKEKENSDLVKINSIKPSLNSIKSDEVTSSLTENDTYLWLYTSKKISNDSGKFEVANYMVTDTTKIDFSTKDYYFIGEIVYYNKSDNRIYTATSSSGTQVYKIVSITSETTSTTWNEKDYEAINYNITAKKYDLEENEVENSDKGLYKSTDDYGNTYYYRGNVKNNYVLFGGFYWKIIRINGDNSIRMIYNGPNKDVEDSSDTIGKSVYNVEYSNPAYSGYMCGKNIGTRSENIKNEVSSTIKQKLDTWYKENIVDKGLSDFVADSGFCNDRTLSVGDGYSIDKGTTFNGYARYGRNTSTLVCPETNDLFTTKSSSVGNKALDYPIGLVTVDELTYAGASWNSNKRFYLYSNSFYFTMTPSIYGSISQVSDMNALLPNGFISSFGVRESLFVRPVINLKSDVEISAGIGTVNDPYVIKTN